MLNVNVNLSWLKHFYFCHLKKIYYGHLLKSSKRFFELPLALELNSLQLGQLSFMGKVLLQHVRVLSTGFTA
jgi:hypothetical protein